METWRDAKPADRHLYNSISIIFRNHPEMLLFFFEGERPRLRHDPMEMRKLSCYFSSGEQLLIKVALDMWSGGGNAKIWQILETLDAENFANVLEALAFLKQQSRAN